MVLLLFGLLPALLVNAAACAVSRSRPSWPFAMARGALAVAACLAACAHWLIPCKRVELFSAGGVLQLSLGKSAVLLCALLPLALGVILGLALREEDAPPAPPRHPIAGGAALALLFVLILLWQAFFWCSKVYGGATLEELLFYLSMPLEGTSSGFVHSVLLSVVLPSVLAFSPVLALCALPARRPRRMTLLRTVRVPLFPLRVPLPLAYLALLAWLALLVHNADARFKLRSFADSYRHASTFIEENYVAPDSVAIAFPERKRNLITIYLESCETTPQDTASGGVLDVNLIPELTQIAAENVSFSRSELFTGAAVPRRCSWTMSGLVAQTAGLPLLNIVNANASAGGMLPGAVALGDLLRQQGYRLLFMAGSDFTFGGRRAYFATHGDYEIWDLWSAREEGLIPQDYYEFWGFEDMKLYEYAKDKLLELAQGDAPFHFSMLTVDTHNPGYRCVLCPTDYRDAGSDALNFADCLRCSSAQLSGFLDWCRQQPFYENTTIVITGDHDSKQTYFYPNLFNDPDAEESIEHYVYNAFVNAAAEPVNTKNRLFTTMDFFPTVLASLGVRIEGDRLGLGTNLFSAAPTLSEQYGEDTLFDELEKKSVFYNEALFYPSQR